MCSSGCNDDRSIDRSMCLSKLIVIAASNFSQCTYRNFLRLLPQTLHSVPSSEVANGHIWKIANLKTALRDFSCEAMFAVCSKRTHEQQAHVHALHMSLDTQTCTSHLHAPPLLNEKFPQCRSIDRSIEQWLH